MISTSEAQQLRALVKKISEKHRIHPNAVWARLKNHYGFSKYGTISCALYKKIASDFHLDSSEPELFP